MKYRALLLTVFSAILVPARSDAAPTYWSLFNIEGESDVSAQYATYANLADMLNDTNRLDVFTPDSVFDAGQNIVGSGSDGSTYWSLFNIEGESEVSAQYATYATLADMLNDTNRLDVFTPDSVFDAGQNIVGSGALVMLPTQVPEAGTLGLAGLGLAGMGFAARYRRRRS